MPCAARSSGLAVQLAAFALVFAACSSTSAGGAGTFTLPDGKTSGGDADSGIATDSTYVDGDLLGSDGALSDAGSDVVGESDGSDDSDNSVDGTDGDVITGQDAYDGPVCTKNAACKDLPDTPYCAVTLNQCVQCLFDTNCTAPKTCVEHKCTLITCTPGDQHCAGIFLNVCNAAGNAFEPQACPDSKPFCVADDCRVCDPGKTYCSKSDPSVLNFDTVMKCSADGSSSTVVQACPDGQQCINNKCSACVPGSKACLNGAAVQCNASGSKWEVTQDCAANGWSCVGGLCTDPCSSDIKANTNVGCDYYAVDLDNVYVPDPKNAGGYLDAQNAQFSVIISNTKPAVTTVTVSATDSTGQAHESKYTVPANGLKILNLPDPLWKVKPFNQDGTSINRNVYRIKSSQPIVAYQFNPLQNYDVFSNDASLLLPSNGLGTEYWVMTREQTVDVLKSYYTIVAVNVGKTHVIVVSSAVTLKSNDNLVKALKPGDTFEVDLDQGQVLNIETNKNGADPTGTWIKADKPVAVFGGSEASNSPNTDHCVNGTCQYQGWKCTTNADCPTTCCSDHMEEQLFPVSSWGTTYLATKTQKRGNEKDAWRILAATDGTTVTTNPPQTTIPVLNQGQWFEFESDQDFMITADHPIMIGQFMASAFAPDPNTDLCTLKKGAETLCNYFATTKNAPFDCKKNSDCPNIPQAGDAKIGDPDFSLLVDKDRYLDNYVFLVPDKYTANYINITIPSGTGVTLDGKAVTGFGEFVSGWSIARVAVSPGSHALKSGKPAGLLVYGWADFVSYSYPGGAALK